MHTCSVSLQILTLYRHLAEALYSRSLPLLVRRSQSERVTSANDGANPIRACMAVARPLRRKHKFLVPFWQHLFNIPPSPPIARGGRHTSRQTNKHCKIRFSSWNLPGWTELNGCLLINLRIQWDACMTSCMISWAITRDIPCISQLGQPMKTYPGVILWNKTNRYSTAEPPGSRFSVIGQSCSGYGAGIVIICTGIRFPAPWIGRCIHDNIEYDHTYQSDF